MSHAPRCLDCGYTLIGLPVPRCPECGRPFDLSRPETFSAKPPFVRWRYWLPGFALALGVGLISYVGLVLLVGVGVAVTFVLPFCIGTLIAYGCRVRAFIMVLLALILLITCVCVLFSINIVGIFCGLTLAGVAVGPLLMGTLAGAMLRRLLKRTSWDQRWHLPALGLMLTPLIWGALESHFHQPYADETVTTPMVLPVTTSLAWHAVMFYEELNHRQSLILRLALPHPLGASGQSENVGDVKVCFYKKGYLAKRVVENVPNQFLKFDVIQQVHVMNRSIRLEDGSFKFNAVDAQMTQVELTTRYEPLLGPRWVWRPVEYFGVHELHRDVLEGMRVKAISDQGNAPR